MKKSGEGMVYSKKNLFFVFFPIIFCFCHAMEIEDYEKVDKEPWEIFVDFSKKLKNQKRRKDKRTYDDAFLKEMGKKYYRQKKQAPLRGFFGEEKNTSSSVFFIHMRKLIDSMNKNDELSFKSSVSELVNHSIDCAKRLSADDLHAFNTNVQVFMQGFKKQGIPGVSLIKQKLFSFLGGRFAMNLILIGGVVAVLYFFPNSKIAIIASTIFFDDLKNIGTSSVEKVRGRVHQNNDMYVRMQNHLSKEIVRLKKNINFILKNKDQGENIVVQPVEYDDEQENQSNDAMEDEEV
jgi:hypothetical protein